jgi:hypothetical protein
MPQNTPIDSGAKTKYLLVSILISFTIKKSHPAIEPHYHQGCTIIRSRKGAGQCLMRILSVLRPEPCMCTWVLLQNCFSISRFYPWPHPSFSERRWNNYQLCMVPPLPPIYLHQFTSR